MTSPYKEKLDEMTWSFSRVNSWQTCPRSFKLQYLDKVRESDSAFSEWGTLCHSIYEDYAKGNLVEYELAEAYVDRYSQYMKTDFPPSRGRPMAESYYERGLEVFATFDGFPEYWEVIGVELHCELKLGDKEFVGYIDLLVKDKRDGRFIVVDHKSKAKFKSKEEQELYAHQPYLYAEWVFRKYGEYPKELIFNMFRAGKEVVIPFSEADCQSAINWFLTTIEKIYADVDFWDKIELEYEQKNKPMSTYKNDDFFCRYICGCREYCLRSGLQSEGACNE